jgi:hypothetical protein
MTNLLFATPWWLLLTLLVVGGVVAWSGNKRQDGRTRNVGLGIVAFTVLLAVVGHFVETDQEKVTRLNGELVQSVPNQDWVKMTDLLDPDATLGTTSMTIFGNRADLVNGAKHNVAQWGLRSVVVTGSELTQHGDGIEVKIRVLSKQDSTEGLVPGTTSDWSMMWDRDAQKQWHCHQIYCLGIGGEKSASVGRYFK